MHSTEIQFITETLCKGVNILKIGIVDIGNGIKVKELIKVLQEQNQEFEVVIGENWEVITSVKVDDNGGTQTPVVVIG